MKRIMQSGLLLFAIFLVACRDVIAAVNVVFP